MFNVGCVWCVVPCVRLLFVFGVMCCCLCFVVCGSLFAVCCLLRVGVCCLGFVDC